jgi:hypothetical protein
MQIVKSKYQKFKDWFNEYNMLLASIINIFFIIFICYQEGFNSKIRIGILVPLIGVCIGLILRIYVKYKKP